MLRFTLCKGCLGFGCECEGKYEFLGEETLDSLDMAKELVTCPNCGHMSPWFPQTTAVVVRCYLCRDNPPYFGYFKVKPIAL